MGLRRFINLALDLSNRVALLPRAIGGAHLLLLLALPLAAQPAQETKDLRLGGIPQMLADKLKEAKPAGVVMLDGRVGGGVYVPIYTLHDSPRTVDYLEVLGLGYRGVEGEKPNVLLMPLAVNLPAISGYLLRGAWSQAHVARSPFPPIFFGPSVFLPMSLPEIKGLRIDRPERWAGLVGSVRF